MGRMWLLVSIAAAVPHSVGKGASSPDFQTLLMNHGGDQEMEITVVSDVVIPSGGISFTNQTSVTITSSIYLSDPATLLPSGNQTALLVPGGSLAITDLRIARQGGTDEGTVLKAVDVALNDVQFENVRWGGEAMVSSLGALDVQGVHVCGGSSASSAPLFLSVGAATINHLRIEGPLTADGWAVEARGGGSISNTTLWWPTGNGFSGPGLELDSVAVVTELVALQGDAGSPIVVEDVVVKGTTQEISGAPVSIKAANQAFYQGNQGAHCGYDARPLLAGVLWSPYADHIGAYHHDQPFPGWDDDDLDGYGYGEECDDDDDEVNPAADELCDDGVDSDCDGGDNSGNVDSVTSVEGWPNLDQDAYGDYYAEPVTFCSEGDIGVGYADNDADCDDQVYGAFPVTLHPDNDGDGYPSQDPKLSVEGCEPYDDYVLPRNDGAWDCFDANAGVSPAEDEDCSVDGFDNDCDGLYPPDDPDCDDTGLTPGDDDDDDDDAPGDDDDDDDDDDDGGSGLTTPAIDDTSLGLPAAGCACSSQSRAGAGGAAWLLLGLVGLRRRREDGRAGAAGRRR
mgnify:FL=1